VIDTTSAGGDRDERRLSAVGGWQASDDPTLVALAAELAQDDERGGGERGGDERGGDERGGDHEAPFDLGIPRPRAMDLRKLWKLTAQKADPQVLAALGPNVPILLAHSVTAFPVGSGTPRVWGIRYHSAVVGTEADTVDLQPSTELLDVVTVGSTADVGISLGGKLEVLPAVMGVINEVPGLDLNDAKIAASVNETAALRISFTLSVPKVISGPDASGGAGWQLYAQDRRLEGRQALIQTQLVPKGTTTIRIEVQSSVAAAGWFAPREWHFDNVTFDVPLGEPRRD
jgi:hypothetical protein